MTAVPIKGGSLVFSWAWPRCTPSSKKMGDLFDVSLSSVLLCLINLVMFLNIEMSILSGLT